MVTTYFCPKARGIGNISVADSGEYSGVLAQKLSYEFKTYATRGADDEPRWSVRAIEDIRDLVHGGRLGSA